MFSTLGNLYTRVNIQNILEFNIVFSGTWPTNFSSNSVTTVNQHNKIWVWGKVCEPGKKEQNVEIGFKMKLLVGENKEG